MTQVFTCQDKAMQNDPDAFGLWLRQSLKREYGALEPVPDALLALIQNAEAPN